MGERSFEIWVYCFFWFWLKTLPQKKTKKMMKFLCWLHKNLAKSETSGGLPMIDFFSDGGKQKSYKNIQEHLKRDYHLTQTQINEILSQMGYLSNKTWRTFFRHVVRMIFAHFGNVSETTLKISCKIYHFIPILAFWDAENQEWE